MEKTKLNSSDYSRLEEVQKLVDSLNSIVTKYNNDTKNKEKDLKDINSQITKKNKSIEKANKNTINFTKKLEELEAIKASAKVRVKELEKEKEELSFSDSDVQKMETQEISELISSKQSKINRLGSLIGNTKANINNNNKQLGELKSDLAVLENAKVAAEKSLERTDALIKLVNDTNKNFIEEVKYILSNDFTKKNHKTPKKEDINEIKNDIKLSFDKLIQSVNDFKDKEPKKPEKIDIKPEKVEEPIKEDIKKPEKIESKPEPKEEIKESENVVPEANESSVEGTDFSILDEWKNELNNDNKSNEEVPNINELEKEVEEPKKDVVPIENIDKKEDIKDVEEDEPQIKEEEPKEESEIETILKNEKIDSTKISKDALEQMEENADRVKDNLEILKKHLIPLDLLETQPDILYKMDKNDLEDLFSIVTTDSDGNGMGFSIEFTYHCLNELATINVDKLIDVYNQEFMNITDKSGIISLLKKTNPELGDFKNTIEANKKILEDFGIENIDEVEKASKKFIELDHPLFESMINVFDKNDLVNKINNDPAIVEQILEYWENN